VGIVGSAAAWFTWYVNPVTTGHVVSFYISSAALTGVTAGTTQLSLAFVTTPAHVPSSPVSIPVLIDTTILASGIFTSGAFLVNVAALTAGAHQFSGIMANYSSLT
jgi:hypothetical protein